MQHNKQHHRKVLLSSFHLNGHTYRISSTVREVSNFVFTFNILRPCPRVSGYFFLRFRLPSTCNRPTFSVTENGVFRIEYALQTGYFLKHRLIVWMGENTMTSEVGDALKIACSVLKASVFKSGKYDSNTLRVDADFFKHGGKNLRFQKYPDTCGQGLSGQKLRSMQSARYAFTNQEV